jgi:hypothetical protein
MASGHSIDIDALDDDTLQVAREAAAAAGMSLEDWVASASCEVEVVGGSESLEGLIGFEVLPSTVSASFFNTDQTATGTLGTPASPAELMDPATFTGWDFTDTWKMDEQLSEFPSLGWQ